MNRASESEVAALKTQLTSQHPTSADSQDQIVPPANPPAQSGSAEDLSTQIARLEEEKQALVAKLGELSRDALSPTSEPGGLLQQLESSNASARSDAAIGLLELRDSRAALPLANYYWRNPDEATDTTAPNRYLSAIFAIDANVGIDFAFRMLQEDRSHRRELAASYMEMLVTTDAKTVDAEKVMSQLQDVALRSKDALVRTRAKLLLQRKLPISASKKAPVFAYSPLVGRHFEPRNEKGIIAGKYECRDRAAVFPSRTYTELQGRPSSSTGGEDACRRRLGLCRCGKR